jgi:hypothetical protein
VYANEILTNGFKGFGEDTFGEIGFKGNDAYIHKVDGTEGDKEGDEVEHSGFGALGGNFNTTLCFGNDDKAALVLLHYLLDTFAMAYYFTHIL